MKTSSKLFALLALAAFAATSLVRAADPAPAATPAPGDGPGRPLVRQAMKNRMEVMSEKLGLTAEQRTKIQGIWKQSAEQGKALREGEVLAQQERRAKVETLRNSTREQVRAVLTPEQQAIFDAMPADAPARKGPARHGPKARAKP